MAQFVCLDFSVTVGGVDLSDHIDKVTINVTADEVDSTAFSSTGWRSRLGGLKEWSVNIEFQQDFAASKVDATLWPLLGSTATIIAKPTSSAVGATNPTFTGTALVSQYSPFDGSVGDLNKTSVTWPGSGALVRATS